MVADLVAVRVVDLLDAEEVDEQHGDATVGATARVIISSKGSPRNRRFGKPVRLSMVANRSRTAVRGHGVAVAAEAVHEGADGHDRHERARPRRTGWCWRSSWIRSEPPTPADDDEEADDRGGTEDPAEVPTGAAVRPHLLGEHPRLFLFSIDHGVTLSPTQTHRCATTPSLESSAATRGVLEGARAPFRCPVTGSLSGP